jgi:hypothetical protein
MSAIDTAKTAIGNSNFELLEEILEDLSKEQIQELAFYYKTTSVTINMSGTWVEESTANLIDASGKLILSDIQIERGFKGWLAQNYNSSNLHSAALLVLDINFIHDYDEDYFSPGEMLFGADYGYGASSSTYEADCKSEERLFNQDDLDDDIDVDECDFDDADSELIIQNAYIVPNRVVITLDGYPSISFKVSKDMSYSTRWFIFSLLFNSSGKTIEDLGLNSQIVSEFMSENFEISF